jgi:hypothetical protein
MPALLAVSGNRVVPSQVALDLKGMGYDIITWAGYGQLRRDPAALSLTARVTRRWNRSHAAVTPVVAGPVVRRRSSQGGRSGAGRVDG